MPCPPPTVTLPGRFADRPSIRNVPVAYLAGFLDGVRHAAECPPDLPDILEAELAERHALGLQGLVHDRWAWAGVVGQWYRDWDAILGPESVGREVLVDLLNRLEERSMEAIL